MRGEKHTKESWECDGEKGVDICSEEVTDCSDGNDNGETFYGRAEYYWNGLEQAVGGGWDCR